VYARRAALLVLLAIVVVGLTGFLGVKTGTVQSTTGGYVVRLNYPRVARSGLDIPWELRVVSPGGFGGRNIVVAISANYYDIFEFQGMHPEPSDETSDGRFVYLTFSPPKHGDTFTTALDTYVQPASQIGRSATTKVFIGGAQIGEVHYKTWLVP
jgi:hypothetical protein